MNVDVLIVGGGIQGLTLLKFLREKGYSAIIVTEKDVGDGQTLHSHGWLHCGYIFPNPSVASNLSHSVEFWKKEFEKHSIEVDTSNKFLVLPEQMIPNFTTIYKTFNFPFKEIAKDELPQSLQNSCVHSGTEKVFQIFDGEYRPELIVQAIATPLLNNIITGELISLDIDESKKAESASVKLPDGKTFTIKPRFVIFATGTATIKTAEKISTKSPEDKEKLIAQAKELQSCKQVPMLCIRGPKEVIPSLGMMYIPLKLFISGHHHQPFEDLSGEKRNMLYVTLTNPTNIKEAVGGDAEAPIDGEILKTAISNLFKIFPSLEKQTSELEFSVYFGYRQSNPTAEQEHAEKFGGLQNVAFVLPSLFTLVKPAADKAVAIVESELQAPKISQTEVEEQVKGLGNGKPLAKIGKVKLDKLKWQNWDQFKVSHKL